MTVLNRRSGRALAVLAVLILGGVFRFYGLYWSLPGSPHPDENMIMITVAKLRWDGDMNPHFFAYGSLPLYMYRFALWGAEDLSDWTRDRLRAAQEDERQDEGMLAGPRTWLYRTLQRQIPSDPYRIPRAISALLGTISLLVLYGLGRRLYGPGVGLLAATALAVSPLHVKMAHFLTVDEILIFFILVGLYGAAGVVTRGSWGDYLLAGLGFGLAMATKVSAAPLAVAVIGAAALDVLRRHGRLAGWAWGLILGGLGLAGAAALAWQGAEIPTHQSPLLGFALAGACVLGGLVFLVWALMAAPAGRHWGLLAPFLFVSLTLVAALAAFFGTQPFAWLDLKNYWLHVRSQASMASGASWPWYVMNYKYTTPVLYQLYNLFFWAMGPLLTLWGAAGLALLAWSAARRRKVEHLLVLAYALPTFAGVYVLARVKFDRYQGPFLPVLALAGAYLTIHLAGRLRRPGRRLAVWAVTAVVLTAGLLQTAATVVPYRRVDTRQLASIWIYNNIPEGATILRQAIEPGLPEPVAGHKTRSYSFEEINVIEEPRTRTAVRALAEKIAAADAIVLPNPGTYNLVISAPREYPKMTAYYKLLFSEQLGFKLAQTVTSFPRLAGIELDDSLADVGFWFFDHPKVQIFTRVKQLPVEQITALIERPPSQVEAITRDDIMARRVDEPLVATGRMLPEDAKGRPDDLGPPPRGFGWIAVWYLIIQFFGILVLPLTLSVFSRLPDRGYVFAKVIGLFLVAWVDYLLVSLKLATFERGSILASILLVGGVALFLSQQGHGIVRQFWAERASRRYVLVTELLFVVLLAVFLAIKAMNPDIHAWEKPSEFSYFNSIFRTQNYPPMDPWMAGISLNYYYYCWHIWIMVAKLAGTPTAMAYNLALGFVPAIICLATFSLVYNITRRYGYAFFGLLTVNLLGNYDALEQVVKHRRFWPFSWFASAHAPIPLTISEFPMWSYVYADLHAHIVVIPVVLLFLQLIHQLLASPERGWRRFGHGYGRIMHLFLWPFTLGTIWVTNTWDLPTQVLILAGALILQRLHLDRDQRAQGVLAFGVRSSAIREIVLPLMLLLPSAYLLYLPVHRNFHPMKMGLDWSRFYTAPLTDFFTVFGYFVVAGIPPLLLYAWLRTRREGAGPALAATRVASLAALLAAAWAAFARGAPAAPGVELAFILPPGKGWLVDYGYTMFAIGGVVLGLVLLAPSLFARLRGGRWLAALAGLAGWAGAAAVVLAVYLDAPGWNVATVAFLIPVALLTYRTLFQRNLARAELFALLVFFSGVALVLGCDVVYIKDFLAGGTWRRMNTVFKFHFQAVILFGLAAPVLLLYFYAVLARLLERPLRLTRFTLAALAASLLALFWLFRWLTPERWWLVFLALLPQVAAVAGWIAGRRTGRRRLRWAAVAAAVVVALGAAFMATEVLNLARGSFWGFLPLLAPFAIDLAVRLYGSLSSSRRPLLAALLDLFQVILVAATVAALLFAFAGTYSKIRERGNGRADLPTLNGLAFKQKVRPHEYAAIQWLNENVEGQPVMLEAPGSKSYLDFSRITMNTGIPTVMGWVSHVVSQNHTWAEVLGQGEDGIKIYDTTDVNEAMALIREHNVHLIYIGYLERETHNAAGLRKFEQYPSLFHKVYENPEVVIYEVCGSRYPQLEAGPAEGEGEEALAASANMFVGGRGDRRGQFASPCGLAVDAQRRLYVADSGNNRIQVFDTLGNQVSVFGQRGESGEELDTPTSLAISPAGDLYVADTWNHQIRRYSLSGKLLATFGGPDELHTPSGVLAWGSGPEFRIVVSDTGNNRLQIYSPSGVLERSIGATGEALGQFRAPAGLASDRSGRLLVADSGNRRIQILDATGRPVESWPVEGWKGLAQALPSLAVDARGRVLATDPASGAILIYGEDGRSLEEGMVADAGAAPQFTSPTGIVVAGKDVFVSDAGTHRIDRFERPEPVRMTSGGDGGRPGQFQQPRDLDVGPDGSVYVVDFRNYRIQKFSADGEFIALWGKEGAEDGQFKDPCGVAVAPDGEVFVADTWNHRIQRFDARGQFVSDWSGPQGMFAPRGIAVGPDGNVYVSDTGGGRVQILRPDGQLIRMFGSRGSAIDSPVNLHEPCGIAVNAAGEIAVADQMNGRIAIFSGRGEVLRSLPVGEWATPGQEPYLDYDAQGNLYATLPANGQVVRFAPDGQRTGVYPPAGAGLAGPTGLAIAPDGRILVVEMGRSAVAVLQPDQFRAPPPERR